jgi:hypothetical protein
LAVSFPSVERRETVGYGIDLEEDETKTRPV